MSDPTPTPFTQTPAPVADPAPVVQPPVDPFSDLLGSITKEDGSTPKYTGVAQALNSINPAQVHIAKIEAENAELREEVTKRSTVEEVLAKIEATNQTPAPQEQSAPVAAVDYNKVVNDAMNQREAQAVATANVNSVISKMTEKFGDKAEEMYLKAATSMNFNIGDMNSLASKSPAAVLKLVGINTDTTSISPTVTQGTVNTEALGTTTPSPVLSGKVPQGATSNDMTQAWRNVGLKQQSSGG